MGLEKVKERVLHEAMDKSNAKIDAASDEAKHIISAATKQAKEKEEVSLEKIEQEIEFIKKKEEAAAKLEAKKQILSLKKEFIDGLFEQVKEKLAQLPERQRASHVKILLRKASKEIDVAAVFCNKKDRKNAGSNVKDAEILGGIIAESADGSIRVDYSYDTMLEQIKSELMPELNKELFEKKK